MAVLAVYHETNTFSPLRTGLDAFARRWYRGSQIVTAFEGTRTMIGGFLDGATAAGLEPVPLFATFATPSGTVERAAFEAIRAELRSALIAADEIDGVLFEVHGDLFVDGEHDAEESLVQLVRAMLPGRPVAIALDMHANMAAPRLRDVEIVIGYRTNPHVDTYERGIDAARMLAPLLHGDPVPHRAHRGLPLVAAPAAQRTEDEPLRSLWELAERIEARPGIRNATVHGGYAYADTAFTGMGFQVTADVDHAEDAEGAADELLDLATRTRPSSDGTCRGSGGRAARAGSCRGSGDRRHRGQHQRRVTGRHHVARARGERSSGTAVPRDHRGSACARSASGSGRGGHDRGPSRGWASPRSGPPLDLEVEVLRVTDGVFANTGPMATGVQVSMGGAAWVRAGGLDLVVQGEARQPNDPHLFGSMGIDVGAYDVLLLKGAAALRAGWAPLVSGFVDAGTPGRPTPCSSDWTTGGRVRSSRDPWRRGARGYDGAPRSGSPGRTRPGEKSTRWPQRRRPRAGTRFERSTGCAMSSISCAPARKGSRCSRSRPKRACRRARPSGT
ncbi:M81 family metallopeptidase [Microbacterium sp. Se63.02b]|uniref:M81 family metallopeptidase n=1 Tax=Microbacterium sp. Se63.02b TaxID=2709304 RepID=UPI0016054D0A|nr:M81 family metallopeptidase [Microbacterium sp. Se63.02b]QNA93792.1 hypothetical protein G4G29_18600 [Microbacterium sp. Se63.02b]